MDSKVKSDDFELFKSIINDNNNIKLSEKDLMILSGVSIDGLAKLPENTIKKVFLLLSLVNKDMTAVYKLLNISEIISVKGFNGNDLDPIKQQYPELNIDELEIVAVVSELLTKIGRDAATTIGRLINANKNRETGLNLLCMLFVAMYTDSEKFAKVMKKNTDQIKLKRKTSIKEIKSPDVNIYKIDIDRLSDFVRWSLKRTDKEIVKDVLSLLSIAHKEDNEIQLILDTAEDIVEKGYKLESIECYKKIYSNLDYHGLSVALTVSKYMKTQGSIFKSCIETAYDDPDKENNSILYMDKIAILFISFLSQN